MEELIEGRWRWTYAKMNSASPYAPVGDKMKRVRRMRVLEFYIPAPSILIVTTTTKHIATQTAGLMSGLQKPNKTDAALSSAGKTITQLYLDSKDSTQRISAQSRQPNIPVIPAHRKRKCRIHKSFGELNVASRYRQIGNHFTQRQLDIGSTRKSL